MKNQKCIFSTTKNNNNKIDRWPENIFVSKDVKFSRNFQINRHPNQGFKLV